MSGKCVFCKKIYRYKFYPSAGTRLYCSRKCISRKYYLENTGKIKKLYKTYREKVRDKMFAILGGPICSKCGFKDLRALQLDHKKGGGAKEFRSIGKNRHKQLKMVKKNPENYQVLCANCNWIKKSENNEVKSKYDKI